MGSDNTEALAPQAPESSGERCRLKLVRREAAEKVVAAHERTALSDRDRELFLKLLDAPPKPNKALKSAAAQYRKRMAG